MNNTITDINVKLKFGELDEVVQWCADNCSNPWDLVEVIEYPGLNGGVYQFHFEDERDLLVFSLRWL